jgi:hypothetical protein
MIKVCVSPTNRPAYTVETEGTLENFQELVGGYIEGISREEFFAYCDEEGRLKNKPFNSVASSILGVEVCGTVVFTGPVDDRGNETSIPDVFVHEIAEVTVS